ncbi:hypothetical protein DL769_003054 [Monosporascus sp. CRB-8-3]|nr:hypothetical protein DL769_003054 [Monosporascus sp. CRB-8-3]
MAPRYDLPGRNGDNDGTGGVIGAISRFWTRSYAPDYLGFACLLTAYLLINFLVEPFHRLFFINDLRISFPHAEVERVPVWLNFVYALFVPLGVLLFWNAVVSRASFHKQHSAVLGLAISLVLASFLTDIVKNTVGRPRPDLVARCKPAAGTAPNVLVGVDVCTETDHHTLHDGWRSFPSGHSSFSFAGLGYLAFFLAGQLRVFRDRRDLGRALLCLAPLLGAALIAISRCQDYRHDVYDVCVGSALGFLVAWFAYRRYWPSLGSRDCDEPYPIPGSDLDERDREGWRRARDEEEGGGAAAGPILGRSAGNRLLGQGTLRENILGVDPESVTDEQPRAARRDASIHGFIASRPDGYNTQGGKQGHLLVRRAEAARRHRPSLDPGARTPFCSTRPPAVSIPRARNPCRPPSRRPRTGGTMVAVAQRPRHSAERGRRFRAG